MVEVRYDTEVTPGIIFFASTHRNTEGGSAGGNGDGVQSNYPFPPLYESTPLRLLVHAIPRQGYGSAKKKNMTMHNPTIIFESQTGGWSVLIIMHARSRMNIDLRIPTLPGRSTSGFHRPGRHR